MVQRKYISRGCSGGGCYSNEIWYDWEQCNNYDGWYGSEYRDYYCSSGACVFNVIFDFSMSVSPPLGSVRQGNSIGSLVTATLTSGSTQAVSFTAVSNPVLTGGSISFAPVSCNPTCNSTMTINTALTTPVNTYTITITGAGGSQTYTAFYTLTVNLANQPPTVDSFFVPPPDFCAPNVSYNFSWTYHDTNDDPELQFDFQIDNNSDFSSPEVSRSFDNISYSPPNQPRDNNQAVLIVPQSPPADYLTYGITYYWQVRVWDNQGTNSGWKPQPALDFKAHRYPVCDFTSTPQYPNVDEEVDFLDTSECYDVVSTGAPCSSANGDTFTWTFPDGTPANSSEESPQDVIFNPYGNKNVTLIVSDGTFSCPITIPVNVRFPLPTWKEIRPQ